MVINIKKNGVINLSKDTNSSLKKLEFGLGWTANTTGIGFDFDPDASVFMLNEHGKCISDGDFIFYGNLDSIDGSVHHTGDERQGSDKVGDPQETIVIDLTKTNSQYKRIDFVVTIYEALKRRQNFGQMDNIFINIVDGETGSEIARYEPNEDFSLATSAIFGSLIKDGNDWKFSASNSQGLDKELLEVVEMYGLKATN
jgi:tellurium resistance protein TerD